MARGWGFSNPNMPILGMSPFFDIIQSQEQKKLSVSQHLEHSEARLFGSHRLLSAKADFID